MEGRARIHLQVVTYTQHPWWGPALYLANLSIRSRSSSMDLEGAFDGL